MDRGVQSWEHLKIGLFGGLTICDGRRRLGPTELGGVRPKQVLEILLAARGHRVPSERLAELLWGPEPPANAGASIQTFISVLRRSLVPDRQRARALVVTEPGAYRVPRESIDLDLDRFDELLERAEREPGWIARRTREQALELASGDVLEDEPYAQWAHELRGEYRGRVADAHLDVAAVALAQRDLGDALGHAAAASAIDRFSERALRTAMLALYGMGRQHDALARYRAFTAALDDELGLTPSADIRALEAAILRQEEVQTLLPRPCAGDRDDGPAPQVPLLGRSDEVALLESAVRRGIDSALSLIQIEGESGAGKTRLLHELAGDLAGVRVGWATCSLLEQHLDYVPLAAALRQARIDASLGHGSSLGRILPELGVADGGSSSSEVEALEALVQALAEHAPVVLLLDDLQFADPATVAALSYIRRRDAELRGAVVVGVRTGYAPDYHPVRALRPDTVVQLCPLTPADLEPLRMPGLYESTGGSPRFVADALANPDGPRPSRSLIESVLAQCWQEGPDAYRILVAASLLEPPFEPHHLEAMLGGDMNGIAEELETLCTRRILRPEGFGFRFRYELVREVLVDSLSPARVRLLQQRLEPLRLADYS